MVTEVRKKGVYLVHESASLVVSWLTSGAVFLLPSSVHILTGPIFVEGAEPGDMIAVEIIDLQLRANPDGKTFGSNAAAWWGYQARAPKVDGTSFTAGSFTDTPDENDEIITIYEMIHDATDGKSYAVPLYQFEWPVLTDPNGTLRDYIAYPGKSFERRGFCACF